MERAGLRPPRILTELAERVDTGSRLRAALQGLDERALAAGQALRAEAGAGEAP